MQIMGAHVIFRADASVAMGTGHVMRCLTLADGLTAQGARVEFACSPETSDIVPRLRASGYRLVSDPSPADLLIIDHYGLGIDYERQARATARRIMVIDDLPVRPHDCDLLLDQTFGRTADQWRPLVPAQARVLTGTGFLLLRPEFAQTCPPRQTLKTILVTLGGTDPGNATHTALDGIALSGLAVDVHVVMGAQAPHLQSVLAQAATMPRVRVHVDTARMADLMRHADLAIGAGGGTAWERCSLGLPTVMLQIADNQKDVIRSLVGAGAAVVCAIDADAIAAQVLALAQKPDGLLSLSLAARRLCPGDGTQKTVDAILSLLKDQP